MNKKLILGIILVILGLIGIASLLTMEFPLPPEVKTLLEAQFTAEQIKLLKLVNPTIMLVVAVILGTILYQKVKLQVPILEKLVGIRTEEPYLLGILKYGISGGILAGILIILVGLAFNPILPTEFKELDETLQPTLAVRFLYGGLTEEVLMRFGLMTFIVWLCTKIIRGIKSVVYWTGSVVSAVIFAVGHFPAAFQAVGAPTAGLLIYILIGNSIGGVIFGWLYWKKGLESAFIAHIFAHLIMIIAEPLLN